MKTLTTSEVLAVARSVPGLQPLPIQYAVMSTNYYDVAPDFHGFVKNEEDGLAKIKILKAKYPALNFTVELIYSFYKK